MIDHDSVRVKSPQGSFVLDGGDEKAILRRAIRGKCVMSEEEDLDRTAPKRRRAAKADVPSTPRAKALQSHGRNSVVYVPVF